MEGHWTSMPIPEDGTPIALVRQLAQHFVHVHCRIEHAAALAQDWGFSAWVASLDDEWFLITAGHCLKEIESREAEGYKFSHWSLDDSAGIAAIDRHSYPFPVREQFGACDDPSGADYGVIWVPPHYRSLMQANGVRPVDAASFQSTHSQFERFWLLGVPQETLTSRGTSGQVFKQLLVLDLDPISPDRVRFSFLAPARFQA